MWRWVVCFFGIGALSATATLANAPHLSGSAIKHLVSDTVMYINTPLNTKIPVRYDADGKLAGAAGSMSFYLGASKDSGRWWVARNKLCHKWKRWFDGDTQCLKLRRSGNKIFWASDTGRTGTAYITRSKTQKRRAIATKPSQQRYATAAVSPPPKDVRNETASVKSAPKQKTSVAKKAARKTTPKVARAKPSKAQVKKAAVPSKQSVARTAKTKVQRKAKQKPAKRVAASSVAARQTAWVGAPSFRVARVSDFDVLNIRKGPSEYHDIVGRIPPSGRGVKIVGVCQSWWCPVQHRNARGWVNRFYLSQER